MNCKNCGRPKEAHKVELQSSGGEYVSGVVYICPTAVFVPNAVEPDPMKVHVPNALHTNPGDENY